MPDNASQQSILITGANGFIGSRLCRHFKDNGYRVLAGVRKTSKLALIEDLDLEYRYGDMMQPDSLPDMVGEVDYIIANAGVVKVRNPQQFIEINESGTRNVFEAIAVHNPTLKKVVYVSSLAAAGPSIPGRPVKESDEPHPITMYGRSKLAGERVAVSFADRLPVVAVRPPGVYGPGDREVLSFFDTVNKGIKPLLGDTAHKLQLVHVDDLCLGIRKAVEAPTDSGSIYFVCENRSYTFRELIQAIKEACQPSLQLPIYLPSPMFRAVATVSEYACKAVGATPMLTREKAGELLAWWEVDTSKARTDLGFDSQIPFPEGARETAAWYRKEGWL